MFRQCRYLSFDVTLSHVVQSKQTAAPALSLLFTSRKVDSFHPYKEWEHWLLKWASLTGHSSSFRLKATEADEHFRQYWLNNKLYPFVMIVKPKMLIKCRHLWMKTWSDTDVRNSQCHEEHAQLKNKPTWTESCWCSNSIGTTEVSMRIEALTGCDVIKQAKFLRKLYWTAWSLAPIWVP